MKKNVIVSLSGLHTSEDMDDTIELIAPGEYYLKNGKHYIFYDDIDEESNEVTKNIIKISEDSVNIKKTGRINTNLTFENGKIKKNYYSTPYGDLTIESSTNKIEINVEETGIFVKINYSLRLNKQHMTDCEVILTIREMQESNPD